MSKKIIAFFKDKTVIYPSQTEFSKKYGVSKGRINDAIRDGTRIRKLNCYLDYLFDGEDDERA